MSKNRECPHCGEEIRQQAVVCIWCKQEVPKGENPESKRWVLVVAVVLFAFLCVWAFGGLRSIGDVDTPFDSCNGRELSEYKKEVEVYFLAFSDAVVLSQNTPRIQLSGPVSDLQQIRRESVAIDHPDCADVAHGLLIVSMDAYIDAFIMFMGDEPDDQVERAFQKADTAFVSFTEEYQSLK